MLYVLIRKNSRELMQALFEREELFPEKDMLELILYANREQNYEMQVALTEYQHKHFAFSGIAETIQKKFEL